MQYRDLNLHHEIPILFLLRSQRHSSPANYLILKKCLSLSKARDPICISNLIRFGRLLHIPLSLQHYSAYLSWLFPWLKNLLEFVRTIACTNVRTSVSLASVVTDPCSYNVHLMFISYSSSVHLITDWSLARPYDYMHYQAEAWSATATKWTNKAKTWLSSTT